VRDFLEDVGDVEVVPAELEVFSTVLVARCCFNVELLDTIERRSVTIIYQIRAESPIGGCILFNNNSTNVMYGCISE
jgi:hypothetical protein